MPKFFTVIVCLLLYTICFSQKHIEKEIDAQYLKIMQIDGDGMYSISLKSEPRTTIAIKGTIDGETFENILLKVKNDDQTLTLSKGYAPFFKPQNDKLAAHKVIAIELEILLPLGLAVAVKSNSASVKASGNYSQLDVVLHQGNCYLDDFSGSATVETSEGDITLITSQVYEKQVIQNKPHTTRLQNTSALLLLETKAGFINILEEK